MNKTTSRPFQLPFVLSRQSQKGQVAVFVALIFQIIFIFFALLINVGLLVHHKINLQQSADLAAYYGASKQAEILNAIAHINYQLKQNYKLLTWRYRILGTFGFQDVTPVSNNIDFPFESNGGTTFSYNGRKTTDMTCPGPVGGIDVTGLSAADLPFFCVSHPGFHGNTSSETICKSNCSVMANSPAVVSQVRIDTAATGTSIISGIAQSLVTQLTGINNNLENQCKDLGPLGANIMTRFLVAYINENIPRTKTLEALAKNLTQEDITRLVDINGGSIFTGSENTFKNNLTSANKDGLVGNLEVKTGLASSASCRFQDGLGTKEEFLKKIVFSALTFYIHSCRESAGAGGNPDANNYEPNSVYTNDGSGNIVLGGDFSAIDPAIRSIIESLAADEKDRFHMGYEKNPYCVEYYAVKASSEPRIPFLPLNKIKLSATAIAKPFGGTIGPWYGKVWNKGDTRSDDAGGGLEATNRLDPNTPQRLVTGTDGLNEIARAIDFIPNYSLFVGDTKGLRDNDYVAGFHSALVLRKLGTLPGENVYLANENSSNRIENSTVPATEPNRWPSFVNWDEIIRNDMPDFRDYDPLAKVGTGVRYLEIAGIAPSQFDVMHYSIEPDFYNNYYKPLYNGGLDAILGAVGMTGDLNKDMLRPDFGAKEPDATNTAPTDPMALRTFSVKDQILAKNIIFSEGPRITDSGYPSTYNQVFKNLLFLQSSLLTGWTFLNYTTYETFPNEAVNDTDRTMSFGQCADTWNNTADAAGNFINADNFGTPMNDDSKFPPVPGNCVTGGRTGYSVKLVTPFVVQDPNSVINPLDASFFEF